LGDSFTEGLYFEDTVAARLEQRLNEVSDGLHFEAVNCACASYSPFLHYLRLKHQFVNLEPDVVVMNIDLTDVFDDYWRYRPRYKFSADGEPITMRNPARWWNQTVAWAIGRFYLGRVVYSHRLYFMRKLHGPLKHLGLSDLDLEVPPTEAELFPYFSTLPIESERWKREVGFCLENIERIIRLCRERGITLIVTVYPHKEQLKPDVNGKVWNREFEYRVEKLCRDQGVDFYSAYEGIKSAVQANEPVFLEHDMHFTPEGQRIWADLLSAYLVPRIRRRGDAAFH
jgi:hypothetical protein